MVNAYVIVRPWNRLTETARLLGETETDLSSNNIGDIIDFRPGAAAVWSTAQERTKFYFIRVEEIPSNVAAKAKERLMEGALNIARILGIGGTDVSPTQALNWLKSKFPAASANFDAYFNGTVEQPEVDVLALTWTKLKTAVWQKPEDRPATDSDLET